jgi:hypothetical protein
MSRRYDHEPGWYYQYGMNKKRLIRFSGPFPTKKECQQAAKERKALGWFVSQPIKVKETG